MTTNVFQFVFRDGTTGFVFDTRPIEDFVKAVQNEWAVDCVPGRYLPESTVGIERYPTIFNWDDIRAVALAKVID